MDEAEYLCDRVAIMDEGKIIALESPDRLIDDLVDPVLKGLKKQNRQILKMFLLTLQVKISGRIKLYLRSVFKIKPTKKIK